MSPRVPDGVDVGSEFVKLAAGSFAASIVARDRLRETEIPEIAGPIAARVADAVTTSVLEAIKSDRPYKCDHLTLPDVAYARAARPARLACVECSNDDLVAHGEHDGPIACDGCGKITEKASRIAARKGFIIIAVAICGSCLASEMLAMFADALGVDDETDTHDGKCSGCGGDH